MPMGPKVEKPDEPKEGPVVLLVTIKLLLYVGKTAF